MAVVEVQLERAEPHEVVVVGLATQRAEPTLQIGVLEPAEQAGIPETEQVSLSLKEKTPPEADADADPPLPESTEPLPPVAEVERLNVSGLISPSPTIHTGDVPEGHGKLESSAVASS